MPERCYHEIKSFYTEYQFRSNTPTDVCRKGDSQIPRILAGVSDSGVTLSEASRPKV